MSIHNVCFFWRIKEHIYLIPSLIWSCACFLVIPYRQRCILMVSHSMCSRFTYFLLHKCKTRKTPNSIIDGFFKKGNQKVTLRQRPTPNLPHIAILKDRFFEKPIQKSLPVTHLRILSPCSDLFLRDFIYSSVHCKVLCICSKT